MIQISYTAAIIFISALWILVRCICCWKKSRISWKRETELLLVYTCLMVVARFTLFPFSKVNGQVQPLNFDPNNWFPFRINLLPLVNLFDYEIRREAWINVIGNTAMFIPIGIIWPSVFRKLDTSAKAIAAGAGFSLCIEVLQLPFFERASDVDDLILNSLGFLMGYGIYLLAKAIKRAVKKCGA